MSSLRAKISKATSKKVPILALVVVALLGMVAGVLAASIIVTPVANSGEIGTLHTNSGTITVVDNGLGVVASSNSTASGTTTFPATGNRNVNNILVAGHWFDQITFTDTATDTSGHVATITIRNGSGPEGALVVSTSFTLTGAGAPSGTITAYVDTGTATLTSPVTTYVAIT